MHYTRMIARFDRAADKDRYRTLPDEHNMFCGQDRVRIRVRLNRVIKAPCLYRFNNIAKAISKTIDICYFPVDKIVFTDHEFVIPAGCLTSDFIFKVLRWNSFYLFEGVKSSVVGYRCVF